METKKNQGKTNNNGTNNTGKQAEAKAPLKERLVKRWEVFRATKGGRWAIRGAKTVALLTALGVTGKKCYDAGVKSVKLPEPEQHIEEPVEETTPEAPAEEPAVEEEI